MEFAIIAHRPSSVPFGPPREDNGPYFGQECSMISNLCRLSRPLMLSAALLAIGMAPRSIARQAAPRPPMVDRTAASGLTLGGDNACWVDIDNDRYPDLVAGGGIWRNRDGRRFERIGNCGPCVAADFDNDGFADLFQFSPPTLLRNDKGKRFANVVLPALPATVSRGAVWADADNDGFVDIIVGGYEDWDRGITYPTLFLHNNGGKSFTISHTDASRRARGLTSADFDRDGTTETYVSNYRLQPNVLWKWNASQPPVDIAGDTNTVATSPGFDGGHSIGAAWGDFDNDGWLDLFAGNFAHVDSRGDQPKSRFLRNIAGTGNQRKFEDKGPSGIHYQESYASPVAGDIDNDGKLDLFFTTVYGVASFGRPNFPVLFRNLGNFQFVDSSETLGLSGIGPTYQAAFADFDRDGDLDLVTGGRLYVNESAAQRGNHWITVRLRGDGTRVNRSTVGAQVRVRRGSEIWTRQVEAGTGEGNQNDSTLHFGLGKSPDPIDIEILWPGGSRREFAQVPVNTHFEAVYGK